MERKRLRPCLAGEIGSDWIGLYIMNHPSSVNLLMRVHHINLTSLVGYCNDENHVGLVYEYMENGNLQAYLSGLATAPVVFTWEGRLQIATDAAQASEVPFISAIELRPLPNASYGTQMPIDTLAPAVRYDTGPTELNYTLH
ncbi:unnamed protein product [Prunus armeniaca]|uniref:Serine-threonine/tyrosine-protein kinase catalytic domain-containing protein n=1 Tax=Prunus armeniaca TaxID=36596 RepID=A0A6J5XAM2_PRUAR|nr:unnamed protein product [Prunus armeniaca]